MNKERLTAFSDGVIAIIITIMIYWNNHHHMLQAVRGVNGLILWTNTTLARAIGRDVKGKLSPVLYAVAIGLAFVHPALADAIYAGVAILWFVPDRRIERRLTRTASRG